MMIHKAGAGPEPIPHKKLNIENLRDAIKFAVSPSAKAAAQRMAQQIEVEVSSRSILRASLFICIFRTVCNKESTHFIDIYRY